MTVIYTSVPEVKAALVDTVLPAAIATLPTTVTVAGTVVNLRAPVINYGTPASPAVVTSYITVGPTEAGDAQTWVNVPTTAPRNKSELYGVQMFIWYSIGDTTDIAQRVATECGYTIYRAIAAQIAASANLGTVIPAGGYCWLSQVTDSEYDAAEGRGVGLTVTLRVSGRI